MLISSSRSQRPASAARVPSSPGDLSDAAADAPHGRIRRSWLAALGALLVCASTFAAVAERSAGAEAARVAGAVQSFYEQTKDVSAHFQQTYLNKVYNRTERSSGQVIFKKPGKMRWDYAMPNGKVIAADGRALVIFEPGEEGEPGQVLEREMSSSQLPNAMAFLMGTGRLEDDFAFRDLDPDHKRFPGGSVLELRPQDKTPHYARIIFYVSDADKTRGLVQRIVIIDHNGNRNRFDFSKFKFNSGVGDKAFVFKPKAGTRRVKL